MTESCGLRGPRGSGFLNGSDRFLRDGYTLLFLDMPLQVGLGPTSRRTPAVAETVAELVRQGGISA